MSEIYVVTVALLPDNGKTPVIACKTLEEAEKIRLHYIYDLLLDAEIEKIPLM